MTTRDRAASIVLIMLVWAAALIFIDWRWNPHPAKEVPRSKEPSLIITLNHFCCTGCYDRTFQAVGRFSWLSNPKLLRAGLPTKQEVTKKVSMGQPVADRNYSTNDLQVSVDPAHIQDADFVKLDRAIREIGLVPNQMKLQNIPHFQLVASLPHLCCPGCDKAAKDAVSPRDNTPEALAQKMPGLERAPILDHVEQEVRAQFTEDADVTRFMRLLDDQGFAPAKITIQIVHPKSP